MQRISSNIFLKVMSSNKLLSLRKSLSVFFNPSLESRPIFIFGCQRSGTTILSKIIGLSSKISVYGEGDQPYFFPEGSSKVLRLRPLRDVESLVAKEKTFWVNLKPLYETQRSGEILKRFPGSKALWIFRNYLDVVDSHINYYGDCGDEYIADLYKEMIVSWKNEIVCQEVLELLHDFPLNSINSATGYALFWLARNSLYFENTHNRDILLINYERLVTSPEPEIEKIFSFLDQPFKKYYSGIVNTKSISKPVNFVIEEKVLRACERMYNRLIAEI